MADALPSIIVTGISGNLGQRLLPMLSGFRVVGVDFRPPQPDSALQFVKMDLSLESSCLEMIHLLREIRPVAVVHLAFVMDAVRTGILDRDRMWQVNVAGTARVMEAVTEANREWPMVEKFIFMSSVSAYGPGLSTPAQEETPLAAHTYVYGIHKMEADRVVQQRAPALRGCSAASTIILWKHFAAFRAAPASELQKCGSKGNGFPACCRQVINICRTEFSLSTWMMWRDWLRLF